MVCDPPRWCKIFLLTAHERVSGRLDDPSYRLGILSLSAKLAHAGTIVKFARLVWCIMPDIATLPRLPIRLPIGGDGCSRGCAVGCSAHPSGGTGVIVCEGRLGYSLVP